MAKWFLACNPTAGGGKAGRYLPELITELNAIGIHPEISKSKFRGNLIELVDDAIKNGFDHIIAAGGDGTNHEAIQAIMCQPDPLKVSYALFPCGTGNDWARTHSIPSDPEKWAKMIKKDKIILHDVGLVKNKQKTSYFINMCGSGFDGFLVHYTETKPKKGGNSWYYLKALIGGLWKYSIAETRIQLDNQKEINLKYYTINIGIGRFAGGGMQICPHANPIDGTFAVTLAENFTKGEIILNIPKLYSGNIQKLSKVKLERATRISLDTNFPPLHIETDGEYFGEAPATISMIPKGIQVRVI